MSSAPHRIEGLAAWRAILMLGGLVLHATMGMEEHLPVAIVNIVSGSFRMGAFFTLSGLMTGMALARHGAHWDEWIQRRLLALSLPTLVGLAVICPVIRLQLAMLDDGRPPALSVYHLWFMVALIDYSALAWLIWRVDRRARLFDWVAARPLPGWLGQPLLLAGAGTMVFLAMVSTATLASGWFGDEVSLLRQLPLVVGYAPLFLTGLVCGRLPAVAERLLDGVRAPVAILIAAAAVHIAGRVGWAPAGENVASLRMMASASWCPLAATVLILRSARRISRVPPLLAALSDAALTMYLVHYPLMLAIRLLIAPLALPAGVAFLAILLGGGTLSWLVHAQMVRRSGRMALLLNGRLHPAPLRG